MVFVVCFFFFTLMALTDQQIFGIFEQRCILDFSHVFDYSFRDVSQPMYFRDAKPHCNSKRLKDLIQEFGSISSLRCNATGSKVAITCLKVFQNARVVYYCCAFTICTLTCVQLKLNCISMRCFFLEVQLYVITRQVRFSRHFTSLCHFSSLQNIFTKPASSYHVGRRMLVL